MHKIYRYHVYPTRSQRRKLTQTLEECQWVYNQALAFRKEAWEEYSVPVSLYDTNSRLGIWKQERPQLCAVHSQVLQNVCTRVDLAFKAFFRRVKAGEKPGYPRFRGKGRYDSFTYPQSGFGMKDGRLHLAKIGDLKIKLHRPIIGMAKTLTLHKTATGKWFACFSCACEPEPLPANNEAVGIDVGLTSFAVLSTGDVIGNPRFFRRDEKDLAKVQRRHSKEAKGTPERKRRCKAVSHIHERIANRRKDFAHQQSRLIVNRFGTICVEDLTVNRMVHNHCLAKSILDAAWSQFFGFLSYKAANADRKFLPVNPAYTSQDCCLCGHRQLMPLSKRMYWCPCCGNVMPRDKNAACNIRARGLARLGIHPLEAPAFEAGE